MTLFRKAATAVRILRREGWGSLRARLRGSGAGPAGGGSAALPVASDDVADADWSQHPNDNSTRVSVAEGPVTIAWVMSPPSATSGGHQNLFRFIDFAEKAGHRCKVYLYANTDLVEKPQYIRETVAASGGYPDVAATFERYDRRIGVSDDVQAIFATSWETAYPVLLDSSNARRFYFVQDFEPAFYPWGSQSMLAENTYRFGFHGITAGGWLSQRLAADYGMATDHFDFAVDRERYRITNDGPRKEIFFYARPSTPRRGFELGLIALERFARERPDVTITFAGEDVSGWSIPFPHRNLRGVDVAELNEVYNRCAAALVVSASNLSLLPLELMAAGVVPVVNDAPNNRLVSDNPFIEYVPPAVVPIVRALIEAVDRPDAAAHARRMAESLADTSWAHSGQQFVTAFEGAMRG